MKAFYKIIISDYKQRTRSYAFLITLAISLYVAYSFVPAPNAGYQTVRVGNYVGVPNAAWIGCVTAMMTSIFLSLVGPFLINSSIKKDMDTGVGMIIATTSISNFSYLLAKAWSNFLVLLSISGCVFLISIILFFTRSESYSFDLIQFILPYFIILLPTMFFIAALAVVAEIFLYRHTTVMNICFFILFYILVSFQTMDQAPLDFFGVKPAKTTMHDIVSHRYHDTKDDVTMGFIFSRKKEFNYFVFEGVHWTFADILDRILWICSGFFLILFSSRFFHRFDINQRFRAKRKIKLSENIPPVKILQHIKLSALPPITSAYGITPFIKTELIMLFRRGPRWLWLLNLGLMVGLIFAPLTKAHQVILPILWFLQVGRWSDLATKEKTNRIHYFTYASYKPLTRLLPAQITAGIILALVLASPLMVRYLIKMSFLPVFTIIIGAAFIVLFAVALGMISAGKKLFEIMFFLFTYLNIERVPVADYFGGVNHGANYLILITMFSACLGCISFWLRKVQIRRL